MAQHCSVAFFWVDVSRFSPINLSRNKHSRNRNICCGLKKCKDLIGWFAWCGSKANCEFDGKRATKPKFVVQSRPALYFSQQLSSPHSKKYLLRDKLITARWKTRNMDPKLATKQCCATSWGFLYLVFRRLYGKIARQVSMVDRLINQKSCGNTRLRLVFPQHFSFSQTSTRVAITRYKHGVFYFLNIVLSYKLDWLALIRAQKRIVFYSMRENCLSGLKGRKLLSCTR